MPLHMSGLISRRELEHPNEKPPVKVSPLEYERVLKFNPHHDAHGRFSSGGSGKGVMRDEMGRPTVAANRLTNWAANYNPQGKFSPRKANEPVPMPSHEADPVGTIYFDNKTLIPTGKKGIPPSDEPVGTYYFDNKTLVPSGDGNYMEKTTGQIYHTGSLDKSGKPTKRSTFS